MSSFRQLTEQYELYVMRAMQSVILVLMIVFVNIFIFLFYVQICTEYLLGMSMMFIKIARVYNVTTNFYFQFKLTDSISCFIKFLNVL